MNLRKAFPCRSVERGATLLELVLVMALLAALSSATVPVSLRFYYTHLQTETLNTVVSIMRSAQLKAQYGYHDTQVGVKLFPTKVVVFEGTSYALRDTQFDRETVIDPPITLEGDSEVVFMQRSGVPSSPAILSFAHFSQVTSVTISAEGLIDKQQ